MKPIAMVIAASAAFLLVAAGHDPDQRPPYGVSLLTTFNCGDAKDRSPYNHTPTLNNGAAITAGNRWLTLDGSNDYASFGDNSVFTINSGFSISVWIRPDSMANFRIASKAQTITTAEWVLSTNASAEYFFSVYSAGSTVNYLTSRTGAYSGDASNWVHICAVYDGSGATSGVLLYRNGALPADTEISGGSWVSISDTNSAVMAGVRFLNDAGLVSYADGDIDDFGIYNRSLTPAEVAQLYSAGRP